MLKFSTWRELPTTFLLWAVMSFALIDGVGAWLLSAHSAQFSLATLRLLQLAALLYLIWHFRLFYLNGNDLHGRDPLGLKVPERQQWRIFLIISLLCLLAVALLYVVWPQEFANIGAPVWVDGLHGFLIMVLLVPLVEELVFRAVIYRMLRQSVGVIAAVILSTFVFAMMHGALAFPQLAGGVIFALAYEWSRNLWIPILLHIGANSMVWLLGVL